MISYSLEAPVVLRATITGDGVWRIRRKERTSSIEVFMVEEAGHGDILSDEFINWRIKLALSDSSSAPVPSDVPEPAAPASEVDGL